MIPEASNLLDKAERSLRNVDHMVYITYPLIKENKLLKLMLEQLYEIANCIVNAILKYEYAYKRIQLYTDSSQNFETFKRCAPRFDISSQEVDNLKTLLTLMQKHKDSSVYNNPFKNAVSAYREGWPHGPDKENEWYVNPVFQNYEIYGECPEDQWCEEGECVPEASTLVLFAVGLLSLVGYLGFRRKED